MESARAVGRTMPEKGVMPDIVTRKIEGVK
jgi:hypothetical protein